MKHKPYGIFDYSELPLVKIELTGEAATDQNFEEYLKESAAISQKSERYISLLDTSKVSYLSAKFRIIQGKYINDNKERIAKQAIAIIFIAPSFLHRTMLKAIFVVKDYPNPVFIVSSKEEGMEKVNELLEEEKNNS
ncbi:hypothetical protein Fleli_3833 [Bernardetia litoralis DSM 6794]|uniref:Uncharacterized protein n=1 Tax=Bernardetia litoralis (strain ATCC 23117 / DSM 6794 / NBRC 15988 / NCIMB 1366 / Fx l1 / Sio-4) TaxID=880071 RepID=I4AQA4_BERLS|nr:hypothetical protein [Bernardetia litoralis]AFM06139.1 hypothetical protein Fleli_3833 [Bernardetia litoralis DSM 6794]